MMKCYVCNKNLPDDAVFCCYCGRKQNKAVVTYHRRPNGLGSVYKTPSGTWCAECTLGYIVENGEKKRKSARKKGFKTKKEAVQYLEQLQPKTDIKTTLTFSELFEKYQPDLEEISASKQSAYRIAWRRIAPALAHRPISEVSTEELCAAAEGIADSYYPRRDIKSLLSHLYKIALRVDAVDKDRSAYIKLPKHDVKEKEIFSDEDISKLWDDYKKSGQRVTAGILIMLYTGMRTKELLDALVENVHLEEHYLTGGAKTEKGKRRKIIIPDKLIPVVSALISEAEKGKLIYYSYVDAFYDAWNAKRAELGIRETLSPYCARHTYVTRCTRLNVSPAMLKELVGHEDYETTLNYTHLSVEDRLAAVNRL